MSDNDGKKTLGLRGTPRSGNVKQSFSHGRTKNVLVETKRKRVVVPKVGATVQQGTSPAKTQSSNRPAGISDTEMARRLKAVQAAKAREAEDSATRAVEEENRQKERERRRAEQAEKEREQREAEEIVRKKSEEETRLRKELEEFAKKAAADAKSAVATPAAENGGEVKRPTLKSAAPTSRKKERETEQDRRNNKGRDDGRRSGKLTLSQALGANVAGKNQWPPCAANKSERGKKPWAPALSEKKLCAKCSFPKRSQFLNWPTAWRNAQPKS